MRTEQFVLDLAVGGFVEPLTKRSVFRMSRLAVLVDHSTVPVLELLARRRFTSWDEEQFPFWVDGDRTNETLANVGLATKASRSGRAAPRSSLGVPSGTKEYMKLWRERNRDKVKASQSRYAEKRRSVLTAAEALAEDDPVLERLFRAVTEGEKTE